MSDFDHPVDFVDDSEVAETGQSSIEILHDQPYMRSSAVKGFATVDAVYGDRYTCDLTSWNGSKVYNVPILAKAFLVNDKVFGEFEMPVKDSLVIVDFIDGNERKPCIIGTVVAFLYDKFQSAQDPVNSSSKAYTKRLFEAGKEAYYRKIFQGGTTVEVSDAGTVIVETPSGMYIKIDEGTSKVVTIEDSFNNKVTMDTNGMKLEDKNGNVVEMGSSSVKINDNLEVLQ